MNRVFLSIALVVAALGGFLFIQATKEGTSIVLTPSELSKNSNVDRVRVAGKVSPEKINYQVEPTIELRFSIEDPGKGGGVSVPVVYRSIKPDMFAAGRDVFIDGDYKAGLLTAQRLLTQCPSKYEPPTPGAEK